MALEPDHDNILAKQLGYRAVRLDEPEISEATDRGKLYRSELWYYIADRNGNRASRNWHNEDNAWEHFYRERWELELEKTRDEMRSWIGLDAEGAHQAADRLLVHALRAAAETLEPEAQQLINDIISAYESVDKWYS